jgi:hypothetical protein
MGIGDGPEPVGLQNSDPGTEHVAGGVSGVWVVSGRVHSRYERRLAGSAIGGQETMIHLRVGRFLCGKEACGKKTFAEQVPGLTVRYGRRSVGLGERVGAQN